MAEQQHTVAGLMELVSEYGQCRWSEGSSGATYLDPLGEKRSREEAADLYQQIEAYAVKLASTPLQHPSTRPSSVEGAQVCEYCGAIEANGEAHGAHCPAPGVPPSDANDPLLQAALTNPRPIEAIRQDIAEVRERIRTAGVTPSAGGQP